MTQASLVRRVALAGALLLSLAGVEGAQAMPASSTLARPAGEAVASVAYYRHRYPRRAGLYNCGRGALRTHLERRACGLNSVGHNGRYR